MYQELVQAMMKPKPFMKGFTGSLSLVFIGGFGDKTFFINMIYASTTGFFEAFIVALAVSELMNLFSICLGKIIPLIMDKKLLDWFAIVIFLFFGIAMLIEGYYVDSEQKAADELKDEEEEKKVETKGEIEEMKEEYKHLGANTENEEERKLENENAMLCGECDNNNKIVRLGVFDSWWKYCIAYIVGELGDKSQIATIVVASKYNFIGVLLGSSLAQLLLVTVSIFLGGSVANCLKRKHIILLGGFTFIFFALFFFIEKMIKFL